MMRLDFISLQLPRTFANSHSEMVLPRTPVYIVEAMETRIASSRSGQRLTKRAVRSDFRRTRQFVPRVPQQVQTEQNQRC